MLINVDLQNYNNLLLYPTVSCRIVGHHVGVLVIDEDGAQGDVILGGAGAEEMIKYHVQGLAVVDKPQNIPAECLVVTITV